MSLTFTNYVRDDAGNPVANATVEAFPVGSGVASGSTTTDTSGQYTLTGLSADSYNIKASKGTQVRWFNAAVAFQATTIYGFNGVDAPLADASIKTSQIQDAAVTTAKIAAANITTAKIADDAIDATKIAAGGADDTAIGNRTIDDTHAFTSNTDTLTNIVSVLAHEIKGITGESAHSTAPADDLNSLDSRVSTLETSNVNLSYFKSKLTSDFAFTSGGGWVNVFSQALTAGTWLVSGQALLSAAAPDLRLYDGTNTLAVKPHPSTGATLDWSFTRVVTLSSSATVSLQVNDNSASGTVSFDSNGTSVGGINPVTWMDCVKISSS